MHIAVCSFLFPTSNDAFQTNPPTPCPELQQTSVFDAEGNDVELHDFQSLIRGVKNGTRES